MRDGDMWAELENLQQRMHQILDRLQQVHAKLATTAVTADRIFSEMSANPSTIELRESS
jgi:hypothetical protein